MYSIKTRVRYTEIDESRQLSILGIINYFQDCSTFHSEDLGVGMQYLEQKKLAWWLLHWQIDIIRRPILGEEIEVGTFAYDFKTFFGMRNFFIKDKAGHIICRADSKWIHMDLVTQRPMKADADMIHRYLEQEPLAFSMYELKNPTYDALKPVFEKTMQVSRFFLDTYLHVNNARYVQIATEAVHDYLAQVGVSSDANEKDKASSFSGDSLGEIVSVKADYKRAATLLDWIFIKVYAFEGGFVVDMDGEDYRFAKIILYMKV